MAVILQAPECPEQWVLSGGVVAEVVSGVHSLLESITGAWPGY